MTTKNRRRRRTVRKHILFRPNQMTSLRRLQRFHSLSLCATVRMVVGTGLDLVSRDKAPTPQYGQGGLPRLETTQILFHKPQLARLTRLQATIDTTLCETVRRTVDAGLGATGQRGHTVPAVTRRDQVGTK